MSDKYETRVKPKLALVEGWARNGCTEDEIARKLHVGRATLDAYRKAHPELDKALAYSREQADLAVEGALFRRALGYAYQEDTYSYAEDNEGRLVEKLVKRVSKEVQPDLSAQIFWLKNRRPDRWRDKPKEAEADEEGTGVVLLSPAEPEPEPPVEGGCGGR